MVCPVPSGLLYARLPDCTGCSGQLGFISVAVDNRERDGETETDGERGSGKEGKERLKGRKTRNTGRKEAPPKIPESLCSRFY